MPTTCPYITEKEIMHYFQKKGVKKFGGLKERNYLCGVLLK